MMNNIYDFTEIETIRHRQKKLVCLYVIYTLCFFIAEAIVCLAVENNILLTVIFAVYLLFMLFRGIVWLYVENINKEIIFIGDAFVLLNEKVVLCSNGERKNLSGNELIILQMLIESKGYVKIHDIIETCWKGHMEESGRKSFNVAFSALNKALADVAHVSLKREKNEIMCIENCNILNRFMRELRLILHIVK
jgi:hypothetical protein